MVGCGQRADRIACRLTSDASINFEMFMMNLDMLNYFVVYLLTVDFFVSMYRPCYASRNIKWGVKKNLVEMLNFVFDMLNDLIHLIFEKIITVYVKYEVD